MTNCFLCGIIHKELTKKGVAAVDRKYITDELKTFADKYNVGIDEQTLGEIVDLSSFRVVPKGRLLSSMGDDTGTVGMVLSGMARSYYVDMEGNDITRGFAPAGALCMDEGLFGFTERMCMWETLEETTVMLCEAVRIRELIRTSAGFKDLWISLLEGAMRYKIYRENGFLVENATERYLHFRRLYPELADRIPLKHIATYLGIAPESLSRIRSAMKEESKA